MKSQFSRHYFLFVSASVLLAITILLLPGLAAADPIDRIRLSRIASETTTEIELGCAMRYLNHTPTGGGSEVRVRLELGYDCQVVAPAKTPKVASDRVKTDRRDAIKLADFLRSGHLTFIRIKVWFKEVSINNVASQGFYPMIVNLRHVSRKESAGFHKLRAYYPPGFSLELR